MFAVAGNLHLATRVFAVLTAVFFTVRNGTIASRMCTFLGFAVRHDRFLSFETVAHGLPLANRIPLVPFAEEPERLF